MKSITKFLESMQQYSTSDSENWEKREEEDARQALEKGRISQQQFKNHEKEVSKMANEPGGVAKAQTYTYAKHDTVRAEQQQNQQKQNQQKQSANTSTKKQL